MINQIKLDNFGPLSKINWPALGKINLVIGGNGSGKTFLLKAIYSSLRTLEEYKRGNEQRPEPQTTEVLHSPSIRRDHLGRAIARAVERTRRIEIDRNLM